MDTGHVLFSHSRVELVQVNNAKARSAPSGAFAALVTFAVAYAIVNALYARYQAAPEGFEARYLEMLGAGGSLRHKALLAPFGLDASDPGFWRGGLEIIAGFIDELEAL